MGYPIICEDVRGEMNINSILGQVQDGCSAHERKRFQVIFKLGVSGREGKGISMG